jgi:NADH-quinone oxidoreductase subunit L
VFDALPVLPGLAALASVLTAVLFVARRSNGPAAAIPSLVASAINVVLALLALRTLLAEGPVQVTVPWVHIGAFELNAGYLLDPLSVTMLLVVTVVSLLVQVFSVGYMKGDDGFARYFTYLSLFVAAMLGLVIADNLLMVYVCWELVGVCSYLLIGFWYRNRAPCNAAKKAFIVTRFGDFGLLAGIILLSSAAQTFDIPAIARLVEADALPAVFLSSAVFMTLVPLLIFFGAAGKSAQFPLHVWLPDAMEGPTPVSALIHAATMVAAGVYLVARLFFLFAASPVALTVVAWTGGLTALMAATVALVQVDIKKVLAYSTISQLGYMMLALGLGGLTAGIFHLATHAFFKALLFLAAGSVIHGLHHVQNMMQMGGLHSRMRVTSWTALVGGLALAGVFPLSGFWSKDEILLAALHQPALFSIGLSVAALTAFYMTRMWFLTFGGAPRSNEAELAKESPASMTIPLVALAAFAVFAGAANLPGVYTLSGFLQPEVKPHPFSFLVAGLGTAAALAGIGLGVALYRRSPAADPVTRLPAPLYRFFERKWYVDDFYEAGVARASIVWAGVVAWFDRTVIDNGVTVAAWVCEGIGGGLRRATTGQPQFYVSVIAVFAVLGAILLAALGGGMATP